jgi:dTDP-4-dehydrorhamnose 3,5-epimerase
VPFEFRSHEEIPDIVIVRPRSFGDGRGWFRETYRRRDFERHGIAVDFRQDNHARSHVRGVLRGLHYQLHPQAQGKLIRCCAGSIWDVAVDIRQGSPTYRQWMGMELSAESGDLLWIPEGFAHGYCTLSDTADVLYKTTAEYSPAHERGIRWDDPALAIRWPVENPSLSPRDAAAPPLSEVENNFVWQDAG